METLSQPQPQFSDPTPVTPPVQKVGKFRTSLSIVKASWAFLMKDKEMVWFPILSVFASLAVIAMVSLVYFFVVLGGDIQALEQANQAEGSSSGSYIYLFLMYFVSYFIVIFFQTGIVAIVHGRMNGQDLSFGDGLRVAVAHAGKIALWSVLAATVGVILRALAERSKLLGRIVISILGAAWSIVTFFIVPVLILDNLSIGESLKSSGETVKKMWGEAIIVNVGASFVFFLLALLGIVAFIGSLFLGSISVVITMSILLVVYLLVLAIISSTLDVIFRVFLYQYAKNGIIPEGLSLEVLQAAFTKSK